MKDEMVRERRHLRHRAEVRDLHDGRKHRGADSSPHRVHWTSDYFFLFFEPVEPFFVASAFKASMSASTARLSPILLSASAAH